jgi:N-acetylmuramoyl-L-alanine amidase CwlA
MLKYGIDINHVYRHFDVTGKSCPAYFVDNNKWAAFKKELLAVVTESSNKKIDTAVTGGTYNQQMFITDVCKILGAFSAKEALAKTVTISESTYKNHALVTPLERYMKALGYYTGSIEADSGKKPSFGPGMTKAIKKYQTYVVKFSQTKNIDGVITAGNTTWKKLLGLK